MYPIYQVVYRSNQVNIKCMSQSEPLWQKNGMKMALYTDKTCTVNMNSTELCKPMKQNGKQTRLGTWFLQLVNVTIYGTANYSCIGYHNNMPFNATSTLVVGTYYL